jgi:mxaC protein
MTFSTRPMPIVSFTERSEVVQAGLAATGIGRGLPHTEMGSALLAAIGQFEGRVYSGSRIVLVVSDGGAQLDEPTRQRIEAGLSRHRIGLYWIYVRSSANSPDLKVASTGADDGVEEVALHRFFRQTIRPRSPRLSPRSTASRTSRSASSSACRGATTAVCSSPFRSCVV